MASDKKNLPSLVRSSERAWISIDAMERDEQINPGAVDERRAQWIAANLDPNRFGVFTLSKRAGGRYVIIDGQNRAHALRLLGYNGEKVEADVFSGLTRAQEAEIFLGLAARRGHSHKQKFAARVTSGDPVAVAIDKIVRAGGYRIDQVSGDGVIAATSALEDVYIGKGLRVKGHNPKALNDTLMVVTAAWDRTSHAVNGQVIKGIGSFFLRYGDAVNRERLVKKLRSTAGGPLGLINRGKGKRELHGGSIAIGIAHYLTDQYNTGLRGNSRLPGWRETEEGA